MPAGLQVFNNSNTVVVDESYFNLVLRQKVAATTTATEYSSAPGTSKYPFTYNGPSYPWLAWQCSEALMVQGFTRSGNNWTFVLRCSGPVGTPFTLLVFAEPSPTEDYGNCGLEVFNASGQRVYHSGAKPARVVDVFVQGAGLPSSNVRTYTADRQYATSMTTPATMNVMQPINPGPPIPPPYNVVTNFGGAGGGAGEIITKTWIAARSGPYDGTTGFSTHSQQGLCVVLDVTNY
ncbi:conserved hypothetical protein [Altererythrobacter sp. B11]|uniref:hypothetical protein n=1 Tax=Altererythrobacter sp. B11 TaxID=2060312 RepID=UPI000DC72163|nr:hypothetical protein [Altererythrobacter sp. B11]BBC72929.1 conserved hypothetical protein [Altererythrobacter sp. B11]